MMVGSGVVGSMISDYDYADEQLVEKIDVYLRNVRENWEHAEQLCTKRIPCANQRTKQK